MIFSVYWVYFKELSIWIKIVQKNSKCEYFFPNFNSKFKLNNVCNFEIQAHTEICTNWINVTYAPLYWILFKVLPISIKIVYKREEHKSYFWSFCSKLELIRFLNFRFSDSREMIIKGEKNEIYWIYDFTEYTLKYYRMS